MKIVDGLTLMTSVAAFVSVAAIPIVSCPENPPAAIAYGFLTLGLLLGMWLGGRITYQIMNRD